MENRSAYFVNNYYLPTKFSIDLRYSEFSALVRSHQLERSVALEKIKEPKPFEEDILIEIKKRVGFTDEEWNEIMQAKPLHYSHYKTYKQTFERLRFFFYILYKRGFVTKSFYTKFCVLKDKRK
jgi:hypothetical protein